MLNEIFKGMDNAAEQIDENFQNGSIVESGVNEEGYYVKYGNGLLEVYQKRTFIISSNTNFTRPMVDFVEIFYADLKVLGNSDNREKAYNALADVSNIGVTFWETDDDWQVVMRNLDYGNFNSTEDFDVIVKIVGTWK